MGYMQNYPQERTIYLTLADVPAVNILYTEIVIRYKKSGQTVITEKILTPSEWLNLGQGMYTVRFTAEEMDTLGNFWFTVETLKADNFVYDEFTIEPVPPGYTGGDVAEPDICVLSGTIKGIGGTSERNYDVYIQPVEFPARYGGNIIAADMIKTVTDAYGNFSVRLVRNSVVKIMIERAAIRHQITIPDAPTADLMNLLPPFHYDFSDPS